MPQMKKYLFTPGPAPVPPEVLLEMARPIIHHRTPEFSAALDSAREGMKPLYGTASEVILLAATGTGAMEAAVINLLQPGEHAIFVNGGKFGERWGKLLAAFGVVGHEVRVEWGRAARPEQVEDAFKAYPNSRAVLVQASETSTCAVHPIAAIGEVTRKRDAMLIVDGITSVGVFEQKMDEWGVDAFVTGSQKALMLPPGLGMVAMSERGLNVAKTVKTPRFYFDLLKELKAQRDEHTTAWTAAVSLIFGLNKSLEMIYAETLPHVYARHALMAEATREAAFALGLKLLAPDNPAPGVTGILVPEGLDGGKLVKFLRDSLGVSIQGGQDQMKGKLVRIGHMGFLSPFDMLIAVGALEMGLQQIGAKFELGAGVAAVQKRLARSV
ncbi:MAG TPA: alanine--glyoxylate aminotransferase family protein [Candidatus Dormibacteraeota bacterium]|nr:alanine--glyoxylate aminotransferase family protein [Candidatus Dormibacteraeota bacterium]